jgi:protein-S-isoprenylcysteine O-methyltransferase Ste14
MMAKAIVATILFTAVSAALFFLSAGRWDLPLPWLYFVGNFLVNMALVLVLGIKDPGLLKERLRPGPGDQDKVYRPVSTVLAVLQLMIAGFDAGRRHWPPVVSAGLQVIALLLAFAGLLIVTWALFTNSFFSLAIRLQPDRNQVVISTGPYRYVRHPGYAGGILYVAFTGLALGSWWASLAAIPILALIIRRIFLEEAMLRTGLPGYSEYAANVPFRIIPGVW